MLKLKPRRGALLCAALAVLLAITGCTGVQAAGERQPLSLMFATDMHFYAPELIGNYERFTEAMQSGDGKLVHYSKETIEALIDTTLTERPDALLLGGDLTYNGEYLSHSQLAQMLGAVREAGIPVLVVPGNHDINQLGAYSYADGDSCATVDADGFSQIYGGLGMADALSADSASLSYMYALGDVRLLMLDSADYDGFGRATGSLSAETLAWVEQQLKAAKKAGATVISVSHHNLLQHGQLWDEPYLISGSTEVVALLGRYGVELNLTGHMHTQNIAVGEGTLADVATGAMAVFPNYYGVVEITADRHITYTATPLDVAKWAQKTGSTDENLLNFADYSQQFFDATTRSKMQRRLESFEPTEGDMQLMLEFAELANRCYFAGTHYSMRAELLAHPGYALWVESYGVEFSTTHMGNIMADEAAEHCEITIE